MIDEELTDAERDFKKILHAYIWSSPPALQDISAEQAVKNICNIVSTFGGLDIKYANDQDRND